MRKRPFALWGLTQGHVIAASLMTELRQTIAVTLHRASGAVYRDPVVERSFTCATSPPPRLSLLPSHPAAIMMATQSTRPVAVKACKTEIARGLFSRFGM